MSTIQEPTSPAVAIVSETVELSDGTEINMEAKASISPLPRPKGSWPLVILCTIAVFAVLYLSRDLIVPIVFAIFLALLLRPVQRRLKRWHWHHGASAALLIGAVVLVYSLLLWAVAGQAQGWLANAPETIRNVKKMLPHGPGPFQDLREAGIAVGELTTAAKVKQTSGESPSASENTVPPEQPNLPDAENIDLGAMARDWVGAFVGTSSYIMGASIIVFVVAYFLLALSDQLTRQAISLVPTFVEKRNVVELVTNVEQGISRYLATIAVINICLGIVTAIITGLLGLPNPILWGVMAAALNSVPHFGAFICMIVLFFVGAISHQSLGYGILTASLFALLTAAESYFITPLVLSKSLELSPLMVILFILFWGWLWGAGGALLAAPLLAVAKIIADQFDCLHGLAVVLGGESPSATTG